jgi:hypothetical protein
MVDYDRHAPYHSHLSWHTALCELASGQYERVMQLYDEAISPAAAQTRLLLRRRVAALAVRGVRLRHAFARAKARTPRQLIRTRAAHQESAHYGVHPACEAVWAGRVAS